MSDSLSIENRCLCGDPDITLQSIGGALPAGGHVPKGWFVECRNCGAEGPLGYGRSVAQSKWLSCIESVNPNERTDSPQT